MCKISQLLWITDQKRKKRTHRQNQKKGKLNKKRGQNQKEKSKKGWKIIKKSSKISNINSNKYKIAALQKEKYRKIKFKKEVEISKISPLIKIKFVNSYLRFNKRNIQGWIMIFSPVVEIFHWKILKNKI